MMKLVSESAMQRASSLYPALRAAANEGLPGIAPKSRTLLRSHRAPADLPPSPLASPSPSHSLGVDGMVRQRAKLEGFVALIDKMRRLCGTQHVRDSVATIIAATE